MMVSALRVLILGLCVVAFAAPVCAQGIANWPAPVLWSPASRPAPARSERALSAEGIAATQASDPLPFVGLTPCRIADTRNPAGPYGAPALTGGIPRDFILTGQCGIPVSAEAVSLNITVTNTRGPGFLLIFPQGGVQPVVSTLNYVAGQTVANAAVVPLNFGGVTVIAGVSGFDLIIDTNGYYGSPTADGSNVFLGLAAGNTTMTGAGNTGIGFFALFSDTIGIDNTAIGVNALGSNTTGTSNTGIGAFALLINTTGNSNTAIGDSALKFNQAGAGNTASGVNALGRNLTGFNNTASGNSALFNNTTGSSNIAIGVNAGLVTTGDANIDIANVGAAGESLTIRIGTQDLHTDTYIGGIFASISAGGSAVFINTLGKLGTNLSARRFKEEIREIGESSDGLMRLRPVSFRYKPELDPEGRMQYGLIAEEVAEVYPELVACDSDGKPLTVHYHLVNALLLNQVQKQERTIEAQERKIEKQTETIEGLEARLARLETRLTAELGP